MKKNEDFGLAQIELEEGDWYEALENDDNRCSCFVLPDAWKAGQKVVCSGWCGGRSRCTVGVILQVKPGKKFMRLQVRLM